MSKIFCVCARVCVPMCAETLLLYVVMVQNLPNFATESWRVNCQNKTQSVPKHTSSEDTKGVAYRPEAGRQQLGLS